MAIFDVFMAIFARVKTEWVLQANGIQVEGYFLGWSTLGYLHFDGLRLSCFEIFGLSWTQLDVWRLLTGGGSHGCVVQCGGIGEETVHMWEQHYFHSGSDNYTHVQFRRLICQSAGLVVACRTFWSISPLPVRRNFEKNGQSNSFFES